MLECIKCILEFILSILFVCIIILWIAEIIDYEIKGYKLRKVKEIRQSYEYKKLFKEWENDK